MIKKNPEKITNRIDYIRFPVSRPKTVVFGVPKIFWILFTEG